MKLAYYGGKIQLLLAKILATRSTPSHADVKEQASIPPKAFFEYLEEHPLTSVDDDGTDVATEANKIIEFLNGRKGDVLNVKRAMNKLIALGGNNSLAFPGENYHPDLLDMTEMEEES